MKNIVKDTIILIIVMIMFIGIMMLVNYVANIITIDILMKFIYGVGILAIGYLLKGGK